MDFELFKASMYLTLILFSLNLLSKAECLSSKGRLERLSIFQLMIQVFVGAWQGGWWTPIAGASGAQSHQNYSLGHEFNTLVLSSFQIYYFLSTLYHGLNYL